MAKLLSPQGCSIGAGVATLRNPPVRSTYIWAQTCNSLMAASLAASRTSSLFTANHSAARSLADCYCGVEADRNEQHVYVRPWRGFHMPTRIPQVLFVIKQVLPLSLPAQEAQAHPHRVNHSKEPFCSNSPRCKANELHPVQTGASQRKNRRSQWVSRSICDDSGLHFRQDGRNKTASSRTD